MSEIIHRNADQIATIVQDDIAEKGWSHYQTGIDPFDAVSVRGVLLALNNRIRLDDTVSPEISVIAPTDQPKTLAQGHTDMSFHTDNVYLKNPCQTVVLFCAVQAQEGGDNELVDGLAVAKQMHPDIQQSLSNPQWQWENPVHNNQSDKFAAFNREHDRIRWWRKTLLNLDMGSTAIANMFEDAINTAPRESVIMQAGDILVTDNSRILHNRSAFRGERRVYRARFW